MPPPSLTNNFRKTKVTPTNYISSEREFIRESESFKILEKYFDIICFAKYLNFAKIKAIIYFAKFLNAFVKPRNLNVSRNKVIYLESPDHPLQNGI